MEIWAELDDRFGKLPQPVKNLLTFVAIRGLGQHLGLKMIRITKREMIAEYSPEILDTQGGTISCVAGFNCGKCFAAL